MSGFNTWRSVKPFLARSVLGLVPVMGAAGAVAQTDPTFKLTADDASANDQLGFSVAINGTTAVVGAVLDDDGGSNSGSAYLFDTTTGNPTFKLTAADATAGDQFGQSVAINGTTAVVGAVLDDDGGSNSGSAYLFDTTTGNQTFKLTAADAAADDQFGYSVGISGTTAVVGARLDNDGGSDSGSAYLFDTTTGNQTFKLTAADAAANDWFGYSVGISGTTAIVGALLDDDAAAVPARHNFSTPPPATPRSSSLRPTPRRMTSSAIRSESAAPPPWSGLTSTTMAAATLARRTSSTPPPGTRRLSSPRQTLRRMTGLAVRLGSAAPPPWSGPG
ncbi:MAG: hypothetical protein AAF750_02815 [Planctomycetota bacterium]